MSRGLLVLRANLILMAAIASPALAADSSPWDGSSRAAIRLIEGAARETHGVTLYRAGIEMRLASGWKTYWRYPGDSGIPPRFDFSASRNVKAVIVHWPAPQRIADETGTSIGYKHDIVLPLEVVPQVAGEPVSLSLNIDYAVCEKLCVPAEGKAELTLSGQGGEQDGKIAQSEALVPLVTPLGGKGPLAIQSATRDTSSARPRVLVDIAAPADATVELFAEGPAADWALPVPAPVAGAPSGLQRFAFELDGLPPDAKAQGAMLTLTAVAGAQAIEVAFRLD